MDIANALGVDNGHDLADMAFVDQILQFAHKGCVAQHMANKNTNTLGFCSLPDLQALLRSGGSRLFQQQIISSLPSTHPDELFQLNPLNVPL